ncbi:MAG: septum formation initiator family protein [Chloroflexi bacterium]|nr:septum formation initiator family protein [Chloroflexota bacterium]
MSAEPRRPVGPPPMALRLVAVLAVPLLLYALFATGQKAIDNYRLNQQADELRVEVVELRSQNIQLQQEIIDAHTDASVEKIAREQLGLVKPGDNALIVDPPPGAQPSAAATPSPTRPADPPPAQQWWDLFFG